MHAVDRYLSIVSVHKESLQLVGAVSLMLCSNNFCKLLSQDGEALELRGLASADDVAYWTDNTYTVDEVTAMEARFMHVRATARATGCSAARTAPRGARADARSPSRPRSHARSGWASASARLSSRTAPRSAT